MTIKIFLLDDHEMVRRGLRDILSAEDDFEVIGEAATVTQGVKGIVEMRPDVALVDVVLPDGNGVEVCETLSKHAPGVKILVLTSFSDDDTLFAAINAGAAGYVLKRVGSDELIKSVRGVFAGHSLVDPRLTDRMFDRLRSGQSEDEERLADLNDRERGLLELVAEGLTNRQIGDRLHLSEKTVKNYVSTLLKKLGMDTRTEAAVFATRLAGKRSTEAMADRGG
ncbi:MAG: two-component system response regulator DevR [Candidatus Aldehydirespiratoraceae bacterium]|jgi:two-component system response regulator DevR